MKVYGKSSLFVRITWLAGILTGLAIAAGAGSLPGSDPIDDLELTRDWHIEVDELVAREASIYYSDYHLAWLARVPEIGMLLISPRGESVQRIDPSGFVEAGDEVTLASGVIAETTVRFESRKGGKYFELDGRAVALVPAPPLLGRQSLTTVEERHPDFIAGSASYRSKMGGTSLLVAGKSQQQRDLTVRVYFGSWSPICQRIVPKILATEDAWRVDGIRFEYYGLPKPLNDDPHAVEQRITGVPTIVVFEGDQEVERLTGRQLDDPAEALSRTLNGF